MSLQRGTLWVLGFELCNWVSLRGLKLGEIVSECLGTKCCHGNSYTVINSVKSSFSTTADFEEEKSLLYNYYIDMRNIFGL